MKKQVLLLFLGLFLASAHAGVSGRIVGGSEVPDGKYSFQAHIKDGMGFLCGAVILNKRYVLTTAQCLAGANANNLRVVVGTNSLKDKSAQVLPVESFSIHENYHRPGGNHGVNDIAIVRLKKNILFNEKVQPVKLPAADFLIPDNTSANFSGWGALKYPEVYTNDLQEIELKVFNQAECKRKWLRLKLLLIEDSMLCTAGTRGRGVCYGDSGSPLTIDGVLIGISSFGYPCAFGHPDVFTRITSYLDWINQFLE